MRFVCNRRRIVQVGIIASCFFSVHLYTKRAHQVNTDARFGRTHFIRGFPQDILQDLLKKHTKKGISGRQEEVILRALFAPDDNLQKEMIRLINDEQKSIKVAMYLFTNKKIAEALLNAYDRGVRIELIIDGSNVAARYSKIELLKQRSGIIICEYHAGPGFNGQPDSIMHNKFVIFECNKNGHSLVWSGSYNFTSRATRKNQENAIISNDVTLINHFHKQFKRLKERCS